MRKNTYKEELLARLQAAKQEVTFAAARVAELESILSSVDAKEKNRTRKQPKVKAAAAPSAPAATTPAS
jgi:hypothetical protein